MVKEMQKAFYIYTQQRYELLAPNIYLDWGCGEMDLLGVRKSGYIDEVEIKISKSDYRADFKKTVKTKSAYKCIITDRHSYEGHFDIKKHDAIKDGKQPCNYFAFLVPEAMSDIEIPEYSGLYIFTKDGLVRTKKAPPLLHKNKISENKKYNIGRKMAYRYWSGLNDQQT